MKLKVKHNVLIIIIVASLIASGIIVGLLIYFLRNKKPNNENSDNNLSCNLDYQEGKVIIKTDSRYFYCQCSTEGNIGRRNDGGYYENNILIEKGLATVDDLNLYPLTFAFGHAYWKPNSVGFLTGNSWNANTNCFMKTKLSSFNFLQEDTIIIEDGIVVCDLSDINVTGIVVRHNGVLLIKGDRDVVIKTQFILIESGGLFQAGSNEKSNNYRFIPKLSIILTHPPGGYDAMGAVTSQYAFPCYNPSARIQPLDSPELQTSYTGKPPFENMFDAKVIAVGFNGNLTLAGQVGESIPYQRTWNVYDESKKNLYLDPEDSLTSFATKEEAELQDIQFDYPTTWVRMEDNIFQKGSKSITIDPMQKKHIKHWKQNDEVILSGKSEQFSVYGDPEGMLGFYVNNQKESERKANKDANEKFLNKFKTSYQNSGVLPDKTNGTEVQTIESIDYENGIIYFKNVLEFSHDSTYTLVDRSDSIGAKQGKIKNKIYVGTCLHVGLLTRNIVITSELNSGGSGCNIMNRPNKPLGEFKGPGGSVVCNDDTVQKSGKEIYGQCYENRSINNLKFCNNEIPSSPKKGSWIFGTENETGCNAIFGGHCFFRLGSSVTLDAIELKYMSTPANFGSIGRYSLHWHHAGPTRKWLGYLPSDNINNYTRDATFANGSNWLSFSRWVAIHGSSNVNIRNNVFFLSYGSSIFTEDSTEINNNIEHNMCILALLCDSNPYYNPIPIYPNVSSDIAAASIIWLKNNQNRVLRNIVASGPSGVIGQWNVPQITGALRGSSTICLGDPIRKLPSLGSAANAVGDISTRSYLSQNLNNWESLKNTVGLTTPCWAPEEFYLSDVTNGSKTHCNSYSIRNDMNPYQLNVDNVCYNLLQYLSEFPETLADYPSDYKGEGGFNCTRGRSYEQSLAGWQSGGQYLPANAQTSCTDTQYVSQGIYNESCWGGNSDDFPYQPLSKEFLADYNSKKYTVSLINKGNIVPKIISGLLTYNLGGSSDLVGGALWLKQGPLMAFGCAFIETSNRLSKGKMNNPGPKSQRMSPQWSTFASNRGTTSNGLFDPCYTSLCQASTIAGPDDKFSAIYNVFDNCIFNGGFAIPSNPSIFSGSKLFFGDRVVIISSEYNWGKGSSAAMYFSDTLVQPRELISDHIWENRDSNIREIALIDFERKFYQKISGTGRTNTELGSLPFKINPIKKAQNIRKYPYVCGDNEALFRIDKTSPFNRPEFKNIVANVYSTAFTSQKAIQKGDRMCTLLSQIEPNLTI